MDSYFLFVWSFLCVYGQRSILSGTAAAATSSICVVLSSLWIFCYISSCLLEVCRTAGYHKLSARSAAEICIVVSSDDEYCSIRLSVVPFVTSRNAWLQSFKQSKPLATVERWKPCWWQLIRLLIHRRKDPCRFLCGSVCPSLLSLMHVQSPHQTRELPGSLLTAGLNILKISCTR